MKIKLPYPKALAAGLLLTSSLANAQSTIFEIVQNSPNHTILETALVQQGLDTTLNSSTIDYTLFAPSDSAFNKYFANTGTTAQQLLANADLTKILLHHVVGSEVLSSALSNAEVTTLSALDVTTNIDNGAKVDSAKVEAADLDATNGVVHSIDYVLLPTYDDVTEIVVGSANHTTLLAALQQANLVATLQDLSKEYTVFAPTNAAFDAYFQNSGTTANDLLASPELSNILLHHVLGSKALSSGLSNGEVTTLNGKDVTVNIDNGVKIDSANVSSADLLADNGVVHVVDYVLLPTYDDVTEIVVGSANHTTLLAALQQANLVATLQDLSKEYTVFAPTNAAFDAYFQNSGTTANDLLASPELSNILLHHVLGSKALSSGLSNGEVTTLNGRDVTVNIDNGVKIDSANVSSADLLADNGVVHVVDYVLLPTYDDVTEIVVGSANHTTLLAALQQANLVATLQDLSKEYTVFAPTNAAFDAYFQNSGTTANDLLASPELSSILLHHVLGSKALSSGLSNGEVTTLNGKDVTVNIDNGVKIDSANVSSADLLADNGVVHVLDYVLLPTYDDVTEIVVSSSDHTTLLAALQQANLVSTLQDLSKEFTVFAPTNAAFDAYFAANNITANDLLNSPTLSNVLLHHVLGVRALSGGLTNGAVTTLNSSDVNITVGSGVLVDTATVTTPDIVADNGVVHVINGVLEIPMPSSVSETSAESINLYPNPTKELLFIDGAQNNGLVQVFDAQGRLVKSSFVNGQGLNVSDLKPGRYSLRAGLQNVTFIKE